MEYLENQPSLDQNPILGAGVSQVEAIRDALLWTVCGCALPSLDKGSVSEWLKSQGLRDVRRDEIASSEHASGILIAAANDYRRKQLGKLAANFDIQVSSIWNPIGKKRGADRSGAGWNEGAAFCISSAFVRLLGALEQFELDVLKALLYYRPAGKPLGESNDHIERRRPR